MSISRDDSSMPPDDLLSADPATARRRVILGIGGTLAGLAAGMSFGTREAIAETRPTLTSLDQRLAALETALAALTPRVSRTEAKVDNSPTPWMWSGGSSSAGTANGWNQYRLDYVEADTCAECISVTPEGVVTISSDGYYRFNIFALQYSSFLRWGSLNINGIGMVWVDNSLQGEWSTTVIDQTFSLKAGDTVTLHFLVSDGGVAYAKLGPFEPFSRLQITRIGL